MNRTESSYLFTHRHTYSLIFISIRKSANLHWKSAKSDLFSFDLCNSQFGHGWSSVSHDQSWSFDWLTIWLTAWPITSEFLSKIVQWVQNYMHVNFQHARSNIYRVMYIFHDNTIWRKKKLNFFLLKFLNNVKNCNFKKWINIVIL